MAIRQSHRPRLMRRHLTSCHLRQPNGATSIAANHGHGLIWLAVDLARSLDPENFHEILTATVGVSESLRSAKALVARSVTVEVLACFGYPHAHEDDASERCGQGLP